MHVSSQDYCHSPSKNIQKHNNAARPFLNLLFPYGHSQNWITTPPPPSHKELLKTTPLSCCSANPQALRMKPPLLFISKNSETSYHFSCFQSQTKFLSLIPIPMTRTARMTACTEYQTRKRWVSWEVVRPKNEQPWSCAQTCVFMFYCLSWS